MQKIEHVFQKIIPKKLYNVLIDGKIFFDVPIKNKEERYEATIYMSKNKDYATGNSLEI